MSTLDENQQAFVAKFDVPMEVQQITSDLTRLAARLGIVETAEAESTGCKAIEFLSKGNAVEGDDKLAEHYQNEYIDVYIKYNDLLIEQAPDTDPDNELTRIGIELLKLNIKLLAGDYKAALILLVGDAEDEYGYGITTYISFIDEDQEIDKSILTDIAETVTLSRNFIRKNVEN